MTELDKDVPLPSEEVAEEKAKAEPPKKKHRGRRAKAETLQPAKQLIEALKFLKPVQKKAGSVQQQFCMITGNWAAASDEVLTIATKVEEDLSVCPQSTQFLEALSKVGEDLSITQLSQSALSVVSGAFKAVVPCVGFDNLSISPPDEPCAVIDDRLKEAFAMLAPLATEGAPNAAYASVLLQSGSAVATNGHVLAEYWHGIDLPPGLLVPKAAVAAILKAGKPLARFGYSGPSATFWFDDDSFIKTQLYGERFPNYAPLFECEGLNPWPVPAEFYKAVRSIEAFTRNGVVYFENGKLASNELENEASTYIIEGLPEGMGFNAKYLLMVEKAFDNVHFDEASNKAFFFGENVRGVIMGVERVSSAPVTSDEYIDDIPF
ncbi:MAG: putative beta sliding clamp [Prokaryotic dsDNA virus sp.]|nr:MAG: putative beta sliding clamp [Prokaryotic dsDNA virus sp.]|tara:strand:+ start:3270 stop:4403 length:1134 start_codon:yes stop_codon:yes gene_type:complete